MWEPSKYSSHADFSIHHWEATVQPSSSDPHHWAAPGCTCLLHHATPLPPLQEAPQLPTWLEGDLTEHHPGISKMVLALDGAGHAVVEGHRDKPSTGVDVVQDKGEGQSVWFPLVGLWAEVTLYLLKNLHTFGKHVVAVDLAEKEACEGQADTNKWCRDTGQPNLVKSSICPFLWAPLLVTSSAVSRTCPSILFTAAVRRWSGPLKTVWLPQSPLCNCVPPATSFPVTSSVKWGSDQHLLGAFLALNTPKSLTLPNTYWLFAQKHTVLNWGKGTPSSFLLPRYILNQSTPSNRFNWETWNNTHSKNDSISLFKNLRSRAAY